MRVVRRRAGRRAGIGARRRAGRCGRDGHGSTALPMRGSAKDSNDSTDGRPTPRAERVRRMPRPARAACLRTRDRRCDAERDAALGDAHPWAPSLSWPRTVADGLSIWSGGDPVNAKDGPSFRRHRIRIGHAPHARRGGTNHAPVARAAPDGRIHAARGSVGAGPYAQLRALRLGRRREGRPVSRECAGGSRPAGHPRARSGARGSGRGRRRSAPPCWRGCRTAGSG